MQAAVDARDVFRIHRTAEGDAAALQGLTLRVEEQEVVAVLGPSGSGKSTLMRILAGLERPSAGSALVLGSDLAALPSRRTARLRASRMGVIDQHFRRALPPDLDCRSIVSLQMAMLGASAAERTRRADELLERVGLAAAAGARPGELSGGEAQRIAICAAVAHRPALLLADEPAGELDAEGVATAYRLIGELAREQRTTVVLVSHDPGVARIGDRAVHIRDGRLSDEAAGAGEAAIVVGRGGWLRLPEELLREAGIGRLARAERRDDGVLIVPAGDAAVEPGVAPVEPAAPGGPAGVAAELRGVVKRYGTGRRERTVLDGRSATFAAGRMTAVTGRSGSGKSTLLRLLAGLDRPTSGEIVVAGEVISGRSGAELAEFRRRHIAVVSQEAGLVGHLSAVENVELALAVRGRPEPDLARAWLGRLGLDHRLDQRVERLSAGERQRVAIARALACAPGLVLVDEPTSRLDQANAAVVGRLLADASRLHGATVIVASHDPVVIAQADHELPLERISE
jgi:ABC-type lipoprotein export system ATPase subunit